MITDKKVVSDQISRRVGSGNICDTGCDWWVGGEGCNFTLEQVHAFIYVEEFGVNKRFSNRNNPTILLTRAA